MWWLLKFIILGKVCKHRWEISQAMRPYSNSQKFIYVCKECGKFKTTKLNITNWV